MEPKLEPEKEGKPEKQKPQISFRENEESSSNILPKSPLIPQKINDNFFYSEEIESVFFSQDETFTLNKKRKSDYAYKSICKKLNFEEMNMNDDNLNTTQNFERIQNSNNITQNRQYISKFDEEFIILKILNESEISTVYLCRNVKSNKNFAVKESKIINSKQFYETIKIFIDEINLNKKNPCSSFIQKFEDFWLEEKINEIKNKKCIYSNFRSYIVSNYYKNGNLKDFFQNLKHKKIKLTADYLWDVIFQMIIPVYFLHSIGYIHFDIKPSNYLINDDGFLILSDFYLTKKESEIFSKKIEAPDGDSIYISPELFYMQNEKLSHKTDIFSLGLSILEILTNEELPKNGKIWQDIRKNGIPQELYDKVPKFDDGSHKIFIDIISKMTIVNIKNRVELKYLLNNNDNYLHLNNKFVLINEYKYDITVLNSNVDIINNYRENDDKYFKKNININEFFTKKSDSI